MHSQLTLSRIAWTAIGKIWAFKEYSSQPIIHQVSSIKYQVSKLRHGHV